MCESCINEHEMLLVMCETKTVFWTKMYRRFCVKYYAVLGHRIYFFHYLLCNPDCFVQLVFISLYSSQLSFLHSHFLSLSATVRWFDALFSILVHHSFCDWWGLDIGHSSAPSLTAVRCQLQPLWPFNFSFFVFLPSYPSICSSPNLILLLSFLFNFY